MDAKPILIVKLPIVHPLGKEQITNIENHVLLKTNNEYHVIVLVGVNNRDIEFQTFYQKDFTEVNYQELKEIIMKSIE